MTKYFINLFYISTIVSCTQNIKDESLKIKDGLYIDSSNGKPLNGNYKSTTTPEHSLKKENVITSEYLNGIPVGKWTDINGDDLIHSGEYLKEESIKVIIQRLTNCKRVDLNLWKELNYTYLTLELIQPKTTDTITLKKVVKDTKKSLLMKYRFNEIIIDSIGETNKNYIYEFEIK